MGENNKKSYFEEDRNLNHIAVQFAKRELSEYGKENFPTNKINPRDVPSLGDINYDKKS